MVDVRKLAARWLMMGLAAGVLAGVCTGAMAQTKRRPQQRARRETNASRQARIARTMQDTYSHKYEVFGGGGYLRFRSGDATKKNNEVSWAANTSYYFNPKWAAVADARGSFGNAHPLQFNNNLNIQSPNPQINEYTFMGGGSYRFYMKEKVALSAQALARTAWGIFSGGNKGLLGYQSGLWKDGFRPAFSLGVSMDYNLYPNLAFRITPTYVGTDFVDINKGSEIQNNYGFNVGVIYRFKRQ